MAGSIFSTGKTVDEALDKGLKTLQMSRTEVEWTVIHEPESKLFGLMTRPAEIEITPKPLMEDSRRPEQVKSGNGVVWIENGELKGIPADHNQNPPVLVFDDSISITYHGEPAGSPLELTDGIAPLSMSWTNESPPETRIVVAVSDDSLESTVTVELHEGSEMVLTDQAKTKTLELRLRRNAIPAELPTKEDILRALQAEGINYGISLDTWEADSASIKKALHFRAAQGKAPDEPIQPTVEYVFENAQEANLDADRVDFFEMTAVRSVHEGETLARLIPGRPGVNGVDVFGRPILARPLHELQLQAGEGATVSTDSKSITAAVGGLPVVQNGVLKVLQIYDLAGDADISTGNIRFNGQVIVRGSVLEQVLIEAQKGGVQVFGLVSHARIKSEGDIVVAKNVVSSELAAGGMTVIYIKVLTYLHSLNRQISDLIKGFYLISQQTQAEHGKLLKNLLELKYHDLPKQVKELLSYYETVAQTLDTDLHDVVRRLGKMLLGRGPLDVEGIHEVESLLQDLQHWESILGDASRINANITIRYAQNSKLEASGKVEVTGKGCYYSSITAAEGFRVTQGVFRGGDITVDHGDIVAKELGGPTGVDTRVKVVQGGSISCQRVYPNVTLSIRNQQFKADQELSSVRVVWSEGEMKVMAGSHRIN